MGQESWLEDRGEEGWGKERDGEMARREQVHITYIYYTCDMIPMIYFIYT